MPRRRIANATGDDKVCLGRVHMRLPGEGADGSLTGEPFRGTIGLSTRGGVVNGQECQRQKLGERLVAAPLAHQPSIYSRSTPGLDELLVTRLRRLSAEHRSGAS